MLERPEKILVIGGSSSVGVALIEKVRAIGGSYLATFRTSVPNRFTMESENWHPLDLANNESAEILVELLKNNRPRTVVFLSGEMSTRESYPMAREHDFSNYFDTWVSKTAWVIQQMSLELPKIGGKFLYMSSRSALYGSHDFMYAAAKSAIHLFVKSLAINSDIQLPSLVLAPGLIEGSGMLKNFRTDDIILHRKKSGASLLTVEDVADEILQVLTDQVMRWDGSTLEIGPRYS